MNRNKPILLILVFLLLLPSISFSKTITGKTISVADGDTITVLNNQNQQTKIRLYGIDTPENGQAFGKKAKKFTSSFVAGKTVRVKIYDTDRYGRSVGVVFVGNTNVNKEIIRAGYAWQYRKYCKASFCSEWLTLEQMAKIARIGLWRDNNPAPPWEWRKAKRTSNAKTSNVVPSGSSIYHGNVKSKVFHGSGCQHYNCKNCVKVFKSVNEAVNSGYRPHKLCVK